MYKHYTLLWPINRQPLRRATFPAPFHAFSPPHNTDGSPLHRLPSVDFQAHSPVGGNRCRDSIVFEALNTYMSRSSDIISILFTLYLQCRG